MPSIDKQQLKCYNVAMLKHITNTIKQKYYIYQRGEFLPVYSGGELINKKQFHIYKAKRALKHITYYFKAVGHEFKQAQQQ